MDSILWNFLPDWVQQGAVILLILSYLAGHFVSLTPSPAPNTVWGKIYGWVEVFGAIYGKAKDEGIPVPEKPTVESLMAEIAQLRSTLTTPVSDPQPNPQQANLSQSLGVANPPGSV